MIRTTEMKCIFSLRWFFRFCPKVMNSALYKNRSCYPPLHVCLYSLPCIPGLFKGNTLPPMLLSLQTPKEILCKLVCFNERTFMSRGFSRGSWPFPVFPSSALRHDEGNPCFGIIEGTLNSVKRD